jgi:uncharacterized protein
MHRNFMKLQLAQYAGQNTFTAYGEAYVSVNAIRHTRNLIVLADQLIPDWTASGFDALSTADFEQLARLDAGIIILGTGNRLRFPRPELLQPLMQAQKGLEVMDIAAACRTYNVLIGEGRKVAAALIFS